jgi:hypothetical protein
MQDLQPRPSLIELYLVEMPVTSGITLDAAVDFSPFLNRWAESLAVHQRVSPFDPTYKDGHCSPVRFLAGRTFVQLCAVKPGLLTGSQGVSETPRRRVSGPAQRCSAARTRLALALANTGLRAS